MSDKINPQEPTFREFIQANLSESIPDIAKFGCQSGFPYLTYYSQTSELYDKYSEELWEMASDDADSFGNASALEFIGSLRGADLANTDHGFKNLMVWYGAERIAQQLEDGPDEPEED